MNVKSAPTRGRTLDHAARVYDICEPMILLGKQDKINHQLIGLLEVRDSDHILDIGCGTGFLTSKIAGKLNPAPEGWPWESMRRPK